MFGPLCARAVVDLPSHLETFVSVLPPGYSYDADYLINNHTLLPFYEPFLPDERATQIRRGMREHDGPKIHTRVGIVASGVSSNRRLRFCYRCVEQDRDEFGECYWHRVHQVPGVHICTKHLVYLQNSNVKLHNLTKPYEFISAETAMLSTKNERRYIDGFDYVLIPLAQDISWLLNYPMSANYAALRARYSHILSDRGLLTASGLVQINKLNAMFREAYPPEVLSLIGCDLEQGVKENWLVRLARWTGNASDVPHPLHHLLLLYLLGFTAVTFFGIPEYVHVSRPFGFGLWPCLNMASDHYLENTVHDCKVVYPKRSNYRPIGTFICKCGFNYIRTGSDIRPEDRFRKDRTLALGNVWKAKLQELWMDPTINIVDAARQLGVDRRQINKQAAHLNLEFPKPGSKSKLRAYPVNNSETPVQIIQMKIETSRERLLQELQQNPEITRNQIRKQLRAQYEYLSKHDPAWLAAHLPQSRQRSPRRNLRVNWAERDRIFAVAAREAAERLRISSEQPVFVTRTAIINNTGYTTLIQKNLDKLPLTDAALTQMAETSEQYAIRRVHWAANSFKQEGIRPTLSQLLHRAYVRDKLDSILIREAVDTALKLWS